jgi:HK97 family phage prohead protease
MERLKGLLEVKEGEILGIASSDGVDRDGDIIKQDGWDLRNYKKNPVLMLMHNYQEFPIGKATDLKVEDGKLFFKAIFSNSTQKAKEAYALVKEGILNCFSVGFIPREHDENHSNIITKAELLEISLVPVPANPEAVVMAKSFKNNEIAEYIIKNFLKGEEKEVKGTSEVDTPKKEDDKENGKESAEVEANDLDLKLLQKTTGYLQQLCRDMKKGGARK